MSFFDFFRRPNVTNIINPALSGGQTDQALAVLTNAIVKNSQGLARKRILAALEALRSILKATPSESP